MAADMGIPTLANMILIGKIIKETGVVSFDNMDAVLAKVISAKRQDMLGVNKQALDAGYNYKVNSINQTSAALGISQGC